MEKLPLHVTFVIAHPDDEAIAFGLAAQLVLNNHQVELVALTKGDLGSHFIRQRRKVARIRRQEFAKSGKILGVAHTKILGLRDGELYREQKRARRRLLRTLRETNPDVVIIHARDDYHEDHRTASQIGQWAVFHMKDAPLQTRQWWPLGRRIAPTTKNVSVYEMDTQGSQTWQSITKDSGENHDHLNPVTTILPISEKAIEISIRAFEEHKSQLLPSGDEQLSYLELATKGAQRRGQEIGTTYGVGLNLIPFGGYAFSPQNSLLFL